MPREVVEPGKEVVRVEGEGERRVLGPLLAERLHALPAAVRLLGLDDPKRREVPVARIPLGERVRFGRRRPGRHPTFDAGFD